MQQYIPFKAVTYLFIKSLQLLRNVCSNPHSISKEGLQSNRYLSV